MLFCGHHDGSVILKFNTMRTTLTLDPDVHALLQDAAHRTGKPFKTTLNDAVRAGLSPHHQAKVPPPQWPVYAMGAPLVDLTKALALADELDDQVLVQRLAAPRALEPGTP